MYQLFSDRLRAVIELSGKQSKELAASCKISPARLSAYVCGKNEPSLEILSTICQRMNCSADYLLGLSDSIARQAPLSLSNTIVPRDPLGDLLPAYREQAENYISFLRKQQEDETSAAKEDA